jgi:DHA1 family bicyclomycin/chloramphenicol resistance-like MFS transporter
LTGLALYALAGTACAVVPGMGTLIVARVVQAFGAGSGPVIARAVVRDLYEPQRAMFGFAFGLGFVLPNAVAGAIAPFPRMAGLASAVLGFVQLTGSALYAIAVSQFYDGTLRPMTTAVATAGVAALVAFRVLSRAPTASPP